MTQRLNHNHNHTLIPIRVDCTDPTIPIHIIDTLLFDPSIWPIPYHNTIRSSTTTTESSSQELLYIDINAERLAYMILADADVIGMGRTVRHFTGRVDVWTNTLYEQIKEQIKKQLLSIHLKQYYHYDNNNMNSKRMLHDISDPIMDNSNIITKRKKIMTDTDHHNLRNDNNEDYSDNVVNETNNRMNEDNHDNNHDNDNNNNNQSIMNTKKSATTKLIPIKIHLFAYGIEIDDEFMYDPSIAMSYYDIANSIGYDLKLSNEIIQMIAIDIAEQIYGRNEGVTQSHDDKNAITTDDDVTSAKVIDSKTHLNYINHQVYFQKRTTSESNN